jgi:hypothetical protein
MKVYATTINDDESLELLIWDTVKAFEDNYSWVDPRWISIATSRELKEMYCYKWDGYGFIQKDAKHIASYNLLHDVYKTL